jgi:hypothetical protein
MNDQKESNIKGIFKYFLDKNTVPVFDDEFKENRQFLKESRAILAKMSGNVDDDQKLFA